MTAKRVGRAAMALGALGLLGAPLMLALSLTAFLPGASGGVTGAAPPAGLPSGATADIPAEYLADFQASAARFAVPWGVLAGIYKLECNFGRSLLPGCHPAGTENAAGAQGPGQFLPGTWRRGLGAQQIIPVGAPTVSDADGYATDGDGDGRADPWDPADAVASTARLLSAGGAASGNLSGAVFGYNHDSAYVEQVLALATTYSQSQPSGLSASSAASGGPSVNRAGQLSAVLAFAEAQLGKPYRWGGAGPAAWDCSGLVEMAYHLAGLQLAHDAAAQFAATSATTVPLNQLEPGDLVFFGRSPASIHHVGISLGGSTMLDAPHTGAVVRIESNGWSDLLAATRPLG